MADLVPFDMKGALLQIEKLESKARYEQDNLALITELLELYNKTGKPDKATYVAEQGLHQFQRNQMSASQGLRLVEAALEHWKLIKYTKKDSMRVNLSKERSSVLIEIKECLIILARMNDPKLKQRINFHLATS